MIAGSGIGRVVSIAPSVGRRPPDVLSSGTPMGTLAEPMPTDHAATEETVELLQALIRNACVNTGAPESGEEHRNADTLTAYLGTAGIEIERFESLPGRVSIVGRIEGTDPTAPTLCLMGHTDVVPVNPAGWSRDPFGGERVVATDGVEEIWGRGAIDMLNLTASMAVATKRLATGRRRRGTIIFFGVADEEAGGTWGAEWMFRHHREAIAADYVLTELGGWSTVDGAGVRRITINTGEKGLAWRRLRVGGTPGHGSMPHRSDNALVTAAEIVRRLATYRPAAHLSATWDAQVAAMDLPADVAEALRDGDRLHDALAHLPPGMARSCHAQTHTTLSPNVIHGGQKTNIIPDVVDIEVDIRTVPGTTQDDVEAMLAEVLGELADRVEISPLSTSDPTESPAATPLWEALAAEAQIAYPGAHLIPGLVVGGTDARFYRDDGAVAYGAGLFSPSIDAGTFASRFHGHDERVDIESLALTTALWEGTVRRLLD